MDAYKQLTTKDVVITPYETNRHIRFVSGSISQSGVGLFYGLKSPKNKADVTHTDTQWDYSYLNSTQKYPSQLTFYYASASVSHASFILNNKTGFSPLEAQNIYTVYSNVRHLYYTNYVSRSWGDRAYTQSLIPGNNSAGNRFSANQIHTWTGSYNAAMSTRYENYKMNTIQQERHFIEQYRSGAFGIAFPGSAATGYSTNGPYECGVFSIPRRLYGEAIQPKSFQYVITGSYNAPVPNVGSKYMIRIYDDGEGNLYMNTSASREAGSVGLQQAATTVWCGNIFYPHGIGVVFDSMIPSNYAFSNNSTASAVAAVGLWPHFSQNTTMKPYAQPPTHKESYTANGITSASIEFSSSVRLWEHQYKVTVKDSEFNYSLNHSLLTGSAGVNNQVYFDFATGSYFSPYLTTVGLYNNEKQLIAVGKLSVPTKIPINSDLTVIVNLTM